MNVLVVIGVLTGFGIAIARTYVELRTALRQEPARNDQPVSSGQLRKRERNTPPSEQPTQKLGTVTADEHEPIVRWLAGPRGAMVAERRSAPPTAGAR